MQETISIRQLLLASIVKVTELSASHDLHWDQPEVVGTAILAMHAAGLHFAIAIECFVFLPKIQFVVDEVYQEHISFWAPEYIDHCCYNSYNGLYAITLGPGSTSFHLNFQVPSFNFNNHVQSLRCPTVNPA